MDDRVTPVFIASAIYPLSIPEKSGAAVYGSDPAVRTLLAFFESKGLAALKQEDRLEQWYDDWIAYQQEHGLYATMLSPVRYSKDGTGFDLLRYARFLEVFAYCSPAHAYSLHVTFLGLFSILMGSNAELKREAVAAMEAGGLLAFGVSEKEHGSDLFATEFTVSEHDTGMIASGSKYYIGNSDFASIISVLAKKGGDKQRSSRPSRAPFVLIALRPKQCAGFRSLGKIRTLGVRAANVGAFEVKEHPVSRSDVIAEGRTAWDAVFGTVTLGKFFLGFGSIGICEHALAEASVHLQKRSLYGSSVAEMPHIRSNMARAFVRLTAMKLYAYRALDYVQSASATDRRYLLFCAVQKAKVSTEGAKVMAIMQECMGARGFESDTYFEMALRDAQLIPGLEGSMHVNLGLAVAFIPRYFNRPNTSLAVPESNFRGDGLARENTYLMEARTGSTHDIEFRSCLEAYGPLAASPNVALFTRQTEAFHQAIQSEKSEGATARDLEITMAIGQCFATIVFGQLVAENAVRLRLPNEMTSAIFSVLVGDLSALALQLAAIPRIDDVIRAGVLKMVECASSRAEDWEFVGRKMSLGQVVTFPQ